MAKGRQKRKPGTEAFATSPIRTPKLPVVRGKKKAKPAEDTSKSFEGMSPQNQTNPVEQETHTESKSQTGSSRATYSESSELKDRDIRLDAGESEPDELDSQSAKSTSSTFGRWRREREKERQTEIAREQEIREEQGRIAQLRNDPGLDGLLAEDQSKSQTSKRRRPLTRLRKILYGVGAFMLAVLLYIGLVFYSPLLSVQTIRVEGASLLDSVQVEQKLEPLKGTPLTCINDQKVRELIDQEHVLRGVQIEAHPPHELVVNLKERTPVAVIHQDGKYMVVDSEGIKLREVENADGINVPLVDVGQEAPQDSAAFRTVANVLSALPSSILTQVKEARASSTSNINLTLKDGVVVQWGTAEESDLKAKVLTKLMEAVHEDQSKTAQQGQATNKVNTYDVSSPRVPVTR